uniref:Solute carrier family 29 member 2 n=1 Tax=Pygocentrus nattereri TaxID=42514 RepID=A0AAR2KEU2_PYGNA
MRTKEEAPKDRGYLVGIIFFILGLGTLLPWNFFMTASMYFNNRLDTPENSNGTVTAKKEYYFNNWMTLLSQLPLLLFTLLNSILYQRVSEKMRIAGSLVFILILFILTAILVKVPMENDRFFSITMATIWFINSFGAVLQGSLFGLVGLLPQKYSAVFMSGQGLGGTFAAVAMLLAIASESHAQTDRQTYTFQQALTHRRTLTGHYIGSVLSAPLIILGIWVMAFCVTFIFTVTLSVFPAVTVDVKTVYSGKWELYFSPVCCFLVFNLMDWTGRTVTSLVQWPPKESRLFPMLVVFRVIFVPLLMLCNVQERHFLPVFFSNDVLFVIIMMLFSISSGYGVCLSMSYAPQLVAPKDAETAGALMTFFLASGLSLGAAFSFPLRLLV